MGNIEDAEIVKCGSKGLATYRRGGDTNYTELLEVLTRNCVVTNHTVTFSKDEWESTKALIKQVESKITDMSRLTPVTQAHGLCKATVCQWDTLSTMRTKANKDANKVERLYTMVEHVVSIVDNLIAEKVVAANEWWTEKAGLIRSEMDNMKRE